MGGIVIDNGMSVDTSDLQKNSKEIKFRLLTGKAKKWPDILHSKKIVF